MSPWNVILSLCEYNQQLAHHASTHSKHRSSFWSSQLSGSLFICNGYSSSCTWTPLSWYRSILFTCLDMMTLSLNESKSMLTPYCPYLMILIEWPSIITTRWNSSLRINTLFYASNNSYAPTPFLSSLGILFHPPKSWLRRPFYVNSRVWYGSWNDLQTFFLNPIHNSTTLSVVLINRKHNSNRSIVNEQEIIDMLTFANQKHMVFSFFPRW